jgi:hypothetical protein
VRRSSAEDIVAFLSVSGDPSDCLDRLKTLSPRQWEGTLRWLDDSGLPFYFLQKLKHANASKALPASVVSRLEENLAANRQRVDDMAHRFGLLNQKFTDAGVRYAVLKGVSLVPEFCEDATLRHQGDFDYLVDDHSLLKAQQVLLETGYVAKPEVPSSKEFVFMMPGLGKRSRSAAQYSARAPHAVELHLDIWDSDQHSLPAMQGLFSVERAISHHWNGFAFPALADDDAFLLQILHACQHLFTYWIRTSCLLEIGHFLSHRGSDATLWNRIEQRVGDNLILREFVVVISELVSNLFGAPLPELVRVWGQAIRPAPRVWIESYARRWVFAELPVFDLRLFPTAKLTLFLHQQYRDACAPQSLVRNRILPFSRISSSVRKTPSQILNLAWWRRYLRRSLYHALAALRYVCEIPRWKWLNRQRMRSASLDVRRARTGPRSIVNGQ